MDNTLKTVQHLKKNFKSSSISNIFNEAAQKNFHVDVKRKQNINMKVC